jgi:superfamily II DNA/RNA helicase
MTFEELQLAPPILKALAQCGHHNPTTVQELAIPKVLAGHDLIASAQTGTGKTAAFVLPALERLCSRPSDFQPGLRVLVMTPTRELADQITQVARTYGKYTEVHSVAIVGGMPFGDQLRALSQKPDMIVGTPGRLIDHIWRGKINLSQIELLVIDEADRMLEMGFISDVEFISEAMPENCQTLLFAATMDKATAKLAQKYMKSPERVEVAPGQITHDKIEQRLHLADSAQHKDRLLHQLCTDTTVTRAIIFSATKRGADSLARALNAQGHPAAALHADMTQAARNHTITDMRRGKIRLLVATDVAARGLDIDGISHVINFDLPRSAEDYVNRIGRTGRAGANGIAISLASRGDFPYLDRIERYLGHKLSVQVIPGLEPGHSDRKPRNGNQADRQVAATGTRRPGQRNQPDSLPCRSEGTEGDSTRARQGAPGTALQDKAVAVEPGSGGSGSLRPSRRRKAKETNIQVQSGTGVETNVFGMPKRGSRHGLPKKAQSAAQPQSCSATLEA